MPGKSVKESVVVVGSGAVSAGKKIITIILILLILSFVFVYLGPQISVGAAKQGYQCSGIDCAWRLPIQGTVNLIEGGMNYVNLLGTIFQERMDFATGEYYTGKVDDNLAEELGVTIEFDKTYDDMPPRESSDVNIWGTVKVKTIDKPLNLIMSCSSKNGKEI